MPNKVEVLRRFFGDKREVTTRELMDLRKADGGKSMDELASLAAVEMGVSIDAEAKEMQH